MNDKIVWSDEDGAWIAQIELFKLMKKVIYKISPGEMVSFFWGRCFIESVFAFRE